MHIQYPLLLDGGLSNVLEEMGFNLNNKLWTANLLESAPEAILRAHLSYLESGAKCIISSSYQASVPGYMELGYDRPEAEALILKSITIACEAIDRYLTSHPEKSKPLVAASVGPYGACVADGSEYTGNYGVTDEVLRRFHTERITILDQSPADILACETIPSLQEAMVLTELLQQTSKPAWMSFSCQDAYRLNDGSSIGNVAARLASHPGIFCLGVNCTAPRFIGSLIKCLKKGAPDKKIVVYPNSGQIYDRDTKTWSGPNTSKQCQTWAREWLTAGADIIGGCCRMGPDHIRAMAQAMPPCS